MKAAMSGQLNKYDHIVSSETSLFLLGVMGCNGDMIKYDKMVVYSRIQAKQVEFN